MAEKKPEVSGIDEQDFNQWLHHPVTKVVHKFLTDYSGKLKEHMLDEWMGGASLMAEKSQEVRGRVVACQEMIDMRFNSLHMFYQTGEEQDDAGSKREPGTEDDTN